MVDLTCLAIQLGNVAQTHRPDSLPSELLPDDPNAPRTALCHDDLGVNRADSYLDKFRHRLRLTYGLR